MNIWQFAHENPCLASFFVLVAAWVVMVTAEQFRLAIRGGSQRDRDGD